jgi:hypothetical protein
MADQKRWFKVWTSLPVDMQHLSLESVGAFTLLGCRTALIGTKGMTTFEGGWPHLAAFLHVPVDEAQRIARTLRNVQFDPPPNRHGVFTVTFKNWTKYQVDTTQAVRQQTSRRKKRGDEIRRETPQTPHDFFTRNGPDPTTPTAPERPPGAPSDPLSFAESAERLRELAQIALGSSGASEPSDQARQAVEWARRHRAP